MSVPNVRRSIALALAGLVLGFAGTSAVRADPRESWGREHRQVQNRHVQTRQWRDEDWGRSQYFRSDECAPRYRAESYRSEFVRIPRRACDSRFSFSFDFGRRDRDCDRSGCR
jgi:hypothetical protein